MKYIDFDAAQVFKNVIPLRSIYTGHCTLYTVHQTV
jgi:hypothetical protein